MGTSHGPGPSTAMSLLGVDPDDELITSAARSG